MAKSLWLACIVLFFFTTNSKAQDWVYVVADGDNIWNISKRYLKDVKYFADVAKINNVRNPKRMQPGTVLRIPFKWIASHASAVTVKHLNGEAQHISGKTAQAVNINTQFRLGDELRLAPKATITLVFADKSEVIISKASIVKFDHLTQFGETGMVDTRLRLLQGKIEVRANKQVGPGARLDIQTASAVTSVRGTVFRVGALSSTAGGKDTSTVEVVEGEVNVAAGAENVAISQGFGLKVEQGKPLGQPVALLPAPELEGKIISITNPGDPIHWLAVDTARSYILVIARDQALTQVVSQQQIDVTHANVELTEDGRYYASISAIDGAGMEGLPRIIPLEANIYPRPPEPIQKSRVLKDGKDQILWHRAANTGSYQLQVADSNTFERILVTEKLQGGHFTPSFSLQPGQYFWRIAMYDEDGKLGPFSNTEAFVLSTPFTRLKLNALMIQKNVRISWVGLADGQYVELELADNPEFENAIRIFEKEKGFSEHTIPINNNLFVRARPILTQSNEKGDWSKRCKISSSSALALCKI